MRRNIVLFVLLVLCCLPDLGGAEDFREETGTTPVLQEVLVTATKTEEQRKDVPNAVIARDLFDIEESPARSIGHLLSNDPGIDWRTYGNYGGAGEELHIRGMDGKATQVFVNGVNINSPSLGTADLGKLPLNNIERVEVVKGSGSLLYGSGAMGGTVHITTKGPKKERPDFRVTAGMGNDHTYRASVEQGMFLSDSFGYYLTADTRDTGGFRDNGDLTSGHGSLKLVFDGGDDLDISLYGEHLEREYGLPGLKPPEGTGEYIVEDIRFCNQRAASLIDRGSDSDSRLVLNLRSRPREDMGINLRGDYTSMEGYNYTRSAFTGTGSRTWTTNRVAGAEGNIEIKPMTGLSLLTGAEYKHYDWENEQVDFDKTAVDLEDSRSRTSATLHTLGTFAEAQYRPCRYFKALTGIRHEDHSKFGTETLPLWGMVINPRENTALKLSHGRHFLAPTPNDLFWPRGTYTAGNPDLKPETGWHTDFTLEQGLLGDRCFLTLTHFRWDVRDKIRWSPDSAGVWVPQNLDTYKGKGWEIGLKVRPLDYMSLNLGYTRTEAEESNTSVTRPAEYTPENTFKGGLTLWSDSGLTAATTIRYVGSRTYYGSDRTAASPVRELESYWTTDLRLDQRVLDHWVVSLQATNIFDREYDTYLANFTDPGTWETTLAGYPGAGASLFFGVTYEY